MQRTATEPVIDASGNSDWGLTQKAIDELTAFVRRLEAQGVRFTVRRNGNLRVRSDAPLLASDRSWIEEHAPFVGWLIAREHAAQAASTEAEHAVTAPHDAEPASPEAEHAARETSEREVQHGPRDAQHTAVARDVEQESAPTEPSILQCDDSGESHSGSGASDTTIVSEAHVAEPESATTSNDSGSLRPEISIYSSGARVAAPPPYPPIDPSKLSRRDLHALGLFYVEGGYEFDFPVHDGEPTVVRERHKFVNADGHLVNQPRRVLTHALGDRFAADLLAGRISRDQAREMAAAERRQLDALRYARTRW